MSGMKKTNKTSLYLLVLFLSIFLFITFAVIGNYTDAFDKLSLIIISQRTDALSVFFKTITRLGDPSFLFILAIFLLVLPSYKEIGLPFSFSALISLSIHYSLKHLIQRPRPDSILWLVNESGYSFPSGHGTTASLAYIMLLYLITKKNKSTSILTFAIPIIVFLIGISRIYLGVHYPSDILGGWFLCFSIFILLKLFLEKYYFTSKFFTLSSREHL